MAENEMERGKKGKCKANIAKTNKNPEGWLFIMTLHVSKF